jgi:hypothetical protein
MQICIQNHTHTYTPDALRRCECLLARHVEQHALAASFALVLEGVEVGPVVCVCVEDRVCVCVCVCCVIRRVLVKRESVSACTMRSEC